MTPRNWYLGLSILVVAILLHAAIPRYTWSHVESTIWTRADRWTGGIELWHASNGVMQPATQTQASK